MGVIADRAVRKATAQALGRLGDTRAVKPLITVLGDQAAFPGCAKPHQSQDRHAKAASRSWEDLARVQNAIGIESSTDAAHNAYLGPIQRQGKIPATGGTDPMLAGDHSPQ